MPTAIDSVITDIVTYTDGFGAWRAHVLFTRPPVRDRLNTGLHLGHPLAANPYCRP